MSMKLTPAHQMGKGTAPEVKGAFHIADPDRFRVQDDGTVIDTQIPRRTLEAQVADTKKGKGKPKATPIAVAIKAEKAALNEAKGVIHGQIR